MPEQTRPRGRPKSQVEYVSVHVRLPKYLAEDAAKYAKDAGQSVAEFIRRAVEYHVHECSPL